MKLKHLNLITLIALGIHFGYAQSLPAKQEKSLRIPDGLKIDGKATEWNGQLQAYNKTTEIFYTIANDDENLYLIVQAVKPRVIEKILSSGITFTVNNTGKKSDKAKENAGVTYPLIKFDFIYDILRKAGDKDMWGGSSFNSAANPMRSRMVTLSRTDSTVLLANRAFNDHAKFIALAGIKQAAGINSTVDTISAFNDVKIKVAAAFDNKGGFTYELAVPLKYLGLSVNMQTFSYGIKLNARGYETGTVLDRASGLMVDTDPDLDVATEFWADCTLAKK